MAFNTQSSIQRRRGARKPPMSEINVTPFVDVVLVLLVIFMVTAPMLTAGVNVDLPQTQAAPISGQDEPLSVTITQNGEVFLQKNKIERKDLVPKLMAITKQKPDTRIFVRGDKKANYGSVIDVVALITAGGFTKVAFVTENPK